MRRCSGLRAILTVRHRLLKISKGRRRGSRKARNKIRNKIGNNARKWARKDTRSRNPVRSHLVANNIRIKYQSRHQTGHQGQAARIRIGPRRGRERERQIVHLRDSRMASLLNRTDPQAMIRIGRLRLHRRRDRTASIAGGTKTRLVPCSSRDSRLVLVRHARLWIACVI